MKLPVISGCILAIISSCSAYAQDQCRMDPSPNEPQCNWESRTIISKRHGFSDMSRAEMNRLIDQNEKLRAERDREYDLCKKKNKFC